MAESHLMRRLFGAMLRRIALLPLPGGTTEIAQQEEKSINKDLRNRALPEKSVRAEAEPGLRLVVRANARFFGVFWGPLGWKTEPKRCRTRQCVVYFYRPKFENGNPG